MTFSRKVKKPSRAIRYAPAMTVSTPRINLAHVGSLSRALEINPMMGILAENKSPRYFFGAGFCRDVFI